MKGMNKRKSSHRKKNDTELAEKHAEKQQKRREKKHNLKIIQKKSKRTGKAVSLSNDSE